MVQGVREPPPTRPTDRRVRKRTGYENECHRRAKLGKNVSSGRFLVVLAVGGLTFGRDLIIKFLTATCAGRFLQHLYVNNVTYKFYVKSCTYKFYVKLT